MVTGIINPYVYVGLKYNEIANVIKKLKTKTVNMDEILDVIVEHFDVEKSEILSITRKNYVVDARYVLFAAIRLKSSLTLSEIAHLTNRDHTTVIYGLKKFCDRYSLEPDYRNKVRIIFSLLSIEYDGHMLTTSI